MKKLFVVAVATLSLIAAQAKAAILGRIDAADLLDHSGALAPLNTVCLMVLDTANNGFTAGTLNAGFSITSGSYFAGSDDVIIGTVQDIANGTAAEGYGTVSFYWGQPWEPEWPWPGSPGQHLGLIWMPNQTLDNTNAVAGWYGVFSDWQGNYSATPWIVPLDGANISFDMTTVSQGGSVPNSYGLANYQIVPEPSTIVQVAVGLLGVFGVARRRSQAAAVRLRTTSSAEIRSQLRARTAEFQWRAETPPPTGTCHSSEQ